MKKFTILFPGQGSQYINMGINLYKKDKIFQKILDDASKILNWNIVDLLSDRNKLSHTKYAQILIFTISYAYYQKFINDYKIFPSIVAGHSLGEITALTVSGMISFNDALFILKERGNLMEKAANKTGGGMLAVDCEDSSIILSACKEVEKKFNQYIDIANYNSKSQYVLSGTSKSIELITEYFQKRNIKNIKLNINGAFHSKLMGEVSNEFRNYLLSFNYFHPEIKVISSVDNTIYTSKNVAEMLSNQIKAPVKWNALIKQLIDDGIDCFIEVGPKKVLSNMLKKDYNNIQIISLEGLYKNDQNLWDYIK